MYEARIFDNWRRINMYLAIICFAFSVILTDVNAQQKCIYVKSTGFVDCRNRNLTTVPLLPPDTRVLDLSDNNIQRLDQGSFNSCLLLNELYLANNSIKFVHYGAFQNLNFLHVLDLSDNKLQNVFTDMPVSLEVLYLDRNPLSNDYILQQRLQYLRYLSLNGVNLTKLPNTWQILPVLKYLDLDNNPSLKISEDDLKPFRALKILNISPRTFSGRGKSQKCQEFLKFVKQRNIEVKNLICYNERKFNLKGKSFDREFFNEDPWYDLPDNVLNSKIKNSDLFDLQTLVSNGLTNFFKLLLTERKQAEMNSIKFKEPLKLDDFVVRNPEQAFRNVFLTGFPLLRNDKKAEVTVSSVDAEELKRFKVNYKVPEDGKSMAISGIFNFYSRVFRFSCELTNANYQTVRSMVRLYDFRLVPIRTEEKLQFDKLKCSLNESSDRIIDQNLSDMVTNALSDYWLDHAVNVANLAIVDAQIRNDSNMFSELYKNRILNALVYEGIQYLKNININSFDVQPSSTGAVKENALDTQFDFQLYNIKIYNLFNYSDFDTKYVTSNQADSMNVVLTTTIYYPMENSAVLAITSKQDPSDVMTFFVNHIQVTSIFEVKIINEVRKLKLMSVNVNISENGQKHALFIIQILKKYLSMELSKEFQRALTFLMNKMDFYSLNGL